MRKLILLPAALMLAAAPIQVQAQGGDTAAADASKPTPEQLAEFRLGASIFRAFSAAIDSDKVTDTVKGRLIVCVYNNKLSDIAKATGNIIAKNEGLKADNPAHVYRAAASVCGIVFKKKADGEDAANGAR